MLAVLIAAGVIACDCCPLHALCLSILYSKVTHLSYTAGTQIIRIRGFFISLQCKRFRKFLLDTVEFPLARSICGQFYTIPTIKSEK